MVNVQIENIEKDVVCRRIMALTKFIVAITTLVIAVISAKC